MRIVGGRHRNRSLITLADRSVRPTADRTREAMFNILAHRPWGPEGSNILDQAVVLDAFLGSGALALEALSRGAERAIGFDTSSQALAVARKNAASLGESGRLTVRRIDALRPPPASEAANLVFLDPPYGRELIEDAVESLHKAGWFAPGAVITIECDAEDNPEPSDAFDSLDARVYGRTRLSFWRAPAGG
ncbi:MAG: 16S rRNA (guanine(966)-N(2))-methyltransferase RsmD [Pseudomonadota bacterium]